jgi:hypothetical protein
MSAGEIRVDTEAMQPGLDALSAVADQVSRIYGAAQSAYEENYGCWGRDQNGQEFSSSYVGAAEGVLGAIRQIGNVVSSTRDGLDTTIKGYTDTENNNVEALSRGTTTSAGTETRD